MQSDRLHNKRYLSWIKTSLSLLYLKQGVTEYSDATATDFHKAVSERVANKSARAASVKCSSCTPKNALRTKSKDTKETTWRMNCRENVCNIWLEEFLPYHEHLPCPHIAWENSDPLLWPIDNWELAKLFQPFGCKEHKSAKDSDATALLSMMKDCKFFNKGIIIPGIIEDIKEARNKCMHSNDMEIDDAEMKTSLTLFASFLQMPCFKKFQACCDAAEKIEQLRDNLLDLSLNKELELEALNNKINEVEGDVSRIADEAKHLHDEFSSLRTTQESTSDDYRKVGERLNEIEEKLKEVKESGVIAKVADLTCRLQKLEKRPGENKSQIESCYRVKLEKLEADLKDLNHVVQELLKRTPEETDLEGVQNQLISLYEKHCQRVPINPLRPSWKKRVDDLYVKPNMRVRDKCGNILNYDDRSTKKVQSITDTVLRSQKVPSSEKAQSTKGNENDTSVNTRCKIWVESSNIHTDYDIFKRKTNQNKKTSTTLDNRCKIKDIFYSDNKLCYDIYLDGEMGTGKTTLCEYLVNLWVRSKTGPRPLKEEDSVMDMFTLVFYISLREANRTFKECNKIDEIITSQLKLNCRNLGKIMKDHVCLIIMDGLDELTKEHESYDTRFGSPHLPERPHTDKCVYFTTSRPFKLEQLARDLEGKIDRQIAMLGLEETSQKELVRKIVHLLNTEYNSNKLADQFLEDMRKHDLTNCLETPVFLTQLLGLWYDGKHLGNSMCIIYSNIIDKQIEFSMKVNRLSPVEQPPHIGCQNDLPDCFVGQKYCQRYKSVLFKVSQLAFERLFDKTRENCLTFDHEQMEISGMTCVEVEQLLQIGILTQHKVFGGITEELKSISFQHKSHQEFFCALYLSSNCSSSNVMQLFAGRSSNIESVLEIEQIFRFVCGMNSSVAADISALILEIASSDIEEETYHHTRFSERQIELLQSMIILGADEARKNNQSSVGLKIHDIYVSETHKMNNLMEQILTCDTSEAKSLNMRTAGDLVFWPLSRYMRTVDLSKVNLTTCYPFTYNFFADHLVVLNLVHIQVTHKQIDCICDTLSSAENLKIVVIWHPVCKTHMKTKGCKMSLDFCCHKKLVYVDIMRPNVDEIIQFHFCVEMKNLEFIRVTSSVCVPAAALKEMFMSLPQNGVLVSLLGGGSPLRVTGEDARHVLDQKRQSPKTHIVNSTISYRDDVCLIQNFSFRNT